jgi:hypothetical protein
MNSSISFLKGLKIQRKDSGLYSVGIGPGFFIPGKQKYPDWWSEFVYINTDTMSTVEVITNKESLPRFDYIVAKPDFSQKIDNLRGLEFRCKKGQYRQEHPESISPEFPNNLESDEILLGFIYNPPQGHSEESFISVIPVNETSESFSYETQPSELRKKITSTNSIWKPNTFYIKEQVVIKDLQSWYCTVTHNSGVFVNDKEFFWEPLSGDINEIDVISIIEEYVKPAAPLHSVQFNLNEDDFGGDEDLLWNKDIKELLIKGIVTLKKQNSDEITVAPNEVKMYVEESNGILYLKIKTQTGREYILLSLKL